MDYWQAHFTAEDTGLSTTLTDIGAATVKILDLNHPESTIERREMIRLGLFNY